MKIKDLETWKAKVFGLDQPEMIERKASVKNSYADSYPLPPEADQNEVYKLIHDHFNITPERAKWFADTIADERKEWIPEMLDGLFLEQKLADNEAYQINQVIENIEAGVIQTLDINIVLDARLPQKQTIKISSPAIISKIYEAIKQLPPGQPFKRKPGNVKLEWKNAFIEVYGRDCIDFLGNTTMQEFNHTDQCYFAALILSLAGIMQTPNQMKETPEVYRENVYDILKRII